MSFSIVKWPAHCVSMSQGRQSNVAFRPNARRVAFGLKHI